MTTFFRLKWKTILRIVTIVTAISAASFAGLQAYYIRKEFNLRNRPFLKYEPKKNEDINKFYKIELTNDNIFLLYLYGDLINFGIAPASNIKVKSLTIKDPQFITTIDKLKI